jgi:hypothetical protein
MHTCDVRLELFGKRLVIEECPWVVMTDVKPVFESPHTVHRSLYVGIPSKHEQRSVGSLVPGCSQVGFGRVT